MRRLFPVMFQRMMKTQMFWLCMAASMGQMLYGILNNYHYTNLWDLGLTPDGTLFMGAYILNITSAVFVAFFLGSEYSNKTIRNKIIVGYSKIEIYFTNVAVCSIGVLMMHMAAILLNATLGVALLGDYVNPKANMIYLFCSFFTVIAKTAIMVFFAMLISSRTTSLIIAVLVAVLAGYGAMKMNMALFQEKTYEKDILDEVTWEVIDTQIVENPLYVDGEMRDLFEFLSESIPYAQDYQYGEEELPDNIGMFPIYSIGLATLISTGGVLIFRRKDIS